MSKAFVRSWLWKTKIYVCQFWSCVQFICRWQAIVRAYPRPQNAIFKPCHLTFSRPEVLLTFFELLCKNRWRLQYLSQAPSDLSAKWNCSFYTSRSWITKNKSGQIVWSSFDDHKKGHFVYFNRKRLDILMFGWNCVFVSNTTRYMICRKNYCTVQSKLHGFLFERNCRLWLQYVVWFFCKIYNLVRQHYTGL